MQIASFGTEAIGLSYSSAATLVIIINGIGIPARVIPPFFADKVGTLNLLVPVLFSTALVAYCWLAVSGVAGFYIFTCFYGLASAAFQCLIPTTVASLTPDMSKVGTRLGMAFSMISFAALTGPPIGGALQAADGGEFMPAQVWAATVTLICACLFTIARISKSGWKWKFKC